MLSSAEPSRLFGKFAERDTVFVGELRGQKVTETGASCLRDLMEAGPRSGGKEHDLSSLRTLAGWFAKVVTVADVEAALAG